MAWNQFSKVFYQNAEYVPLPPMAKSVRIGGLMEKWKCDKGKVVFSAFYRACTLLVVSELSIFHSEIEGCHLWWSLFINKITMLLCSTKHWIIVWNDIRVVLSSPPFWVWWAGMKLVDDKIQNYLNENTQNQRHVDRRERRVVLAAKYSGVRYNATLRRVTSHCTWMVQSNLMWWCNNHLCSQK